MTYHIILPILFLWQRVPFFSPTIEIFLLFFIIKRRNSYSSSSAYVFLISGYIGMAYLVILFMHYYATMMYKVYLINII